MSFFRPMSLLLHWQWGRCFALHVSLLKPWPHTLLECMLQDQCPASSKYLINMCRGNVWARQGRYCLKEHLRFPVTENHWPEREWLGYVTKLWEVRWCGWPQGQPEPVFPLSVSLGVRCIPPIRDQLFPHGRDLGTTSSIFISHSSSN